MPPCDISIYICARITGRYIRCAVTPEGKDTSTASSLFSCEDEEDTGVDYQWNRLIELKTRNNLCLPHLETAYPVETQAGYHKGQYNEDMTRDQLSDASILQLNTRKQRPEAMFDVKCDLLVKVTKQSLRDDSLRENIVVGIENTPKALRRGLKRQNGFVRRNEEPSRSSQIERNPLGNRNVGQTDL